MSDAGPARLFLLGAATPAALDRQLGALRLPNAGREPAAATPEPAAASAPRAATREPADASGPATAAREPADAPRGPTPLRAALVAATTAELETRAGRLREALAESADGTLWVGQGTALGRLRSAARVGFLFPGQGGPAGAAPGALAERFPEAAGAYAAAGLPVTAASVAPEQVQLSIVTASLAALRVLRSLAVEADVAVGHSLGELSALHWAGACAEQTLVRLARSRGRAMTQDTDGGAMATVTAGDVGLRELIDGADVSVACFNSPRQCVVSGSVKSVDRVVAGARESGARATRLKVTGAFHSRLMEPAVPAFRASLARESLRRPERRVISTVTAAPLAADADLRELLADQILRPVRFVEAARLLLDESDLLIEVGPGRALARLVAELAPTPVVSVRSESRSLDGLLSTVGACHCARLPVVTAALPEAVEPPCPGEC